MGRLTRATIVSEALLMAGNAQLTARANVWLNLWLDATYKSWPWPFLQARTQDLSLPAGTNTLYVGNSAIAGGNYVVPACITDIVDPVYLYTSDRSSQQICRIRHSSNAPLYIDETANQGASGPPLYVKITMDQANPTVPYGSWKLSFWPTPSINMLAAFDYYYLPNIIPTDSTGDASIPLYPSDRTMIQAVACEAWKYMDRQDKFAEELPVLSAYVGTDREKYGVIMGTGDEAYLDNRIYRTGPYNGVF